MVAVMGAALLCPWHAGWFPACADIVASLCWNTNRGGVWRTGLPICSRCAHCRIRLYYCVRSSVHLSQLISSQALLQTRLHPPLLAADVTPRPRLDALIQRGVQHKLLLVIAPAGYGKTTAVLSWAQQHPLPIAWLSLNAAADDLVGFVAYVVAAIQRVAPDACAESEMLVQSG